MDRRKVTYAELKERGELLVEEHVGKPKIYRLNGRYYRVEWRSFGGFTGSGGWHVSEIGGQS